MVGRVHDVGMGFSDSDVEFLYEVYLSSRKRRKFRPRPDIFDDYDDDEFLCRFRLSKPTVLSVLDIIKNDLAHKTERNHSVPPLTQLLLALRFYACGAFLICMGDFCGIHKSSASRIIKRVSEAIAKLAPRFINFPQGEKRNKVREDFFKIAAFPRVIGAIDCTHVPIKSPGGDTAELYRGRDGKFSISVQTVCGPDLSILDVVARWPGSTHDQTIFNNSWLKAKFEMGRMGDSVLLGDSGYALTKYLLTPILRTTSPAGNLYNEAQIRTRNTVERSYGVWKRRFPILANGLRLKKDRTEAIIVACAVLHNIAIRSKDKEPPVSEETNLLIENGLVNERENGGMEYVENNTTREHFIAYFNNFL